MTETDLRQRKQQFFTFENNGLVKTASLVGNESQTIGGLPLPSYTKQLSPILDDDKYQKYNVQSSKATDFIDSVVVLLPFN
jgi:hypothetical protein